MKIKKLIRNRSPIILSVLGIGGFITSVIMAAKAGPVVEDILHDLPPNSTFIEKTKAVTPVLAPTAGMVLLSTACIVGSNRIYRRRYTSLLALYSIGEKSLKKWQDSILDEIGQKRFEKVRERVVAPEGEIPEEIILDENRVLCYDSFSGRYFRTDSVETIRRIINDLNDVLYSDDFVPINHFYHAIGLPRIEIGDEIGWEIANGSIQVVFDSFLSNDRPCVIISFRLSPQGYEFLLK